MANHTISGAATLPDNVTPLRGTWEISIYSSTGTVFDVDSTWRGSSQRYSTNADGSLTISLPETTADFLYRATFTSRDRRTTVGPIVFDLTANRTWQGIIGTPTLTPPALSPLDTIHDVVAAMILEGANISKLYDPDAGTLTISSTGGGGGGLTLEQVQDAVAAMILEGSNITKVYDDTAGTLTLSAAGGGGWSAVDASETVKGIAEVATQGETDTGTDDTRVVTPLKLAANLSSRLPAAADKVVYVSPRGDNGNDGKTLKTALATIQAAITALGGPGLILLAQGAHTTASSISLASAAGVTIRGVSGTTSGATPATVLTFTGTGSGSFIDARSSTGVVIENVMILYSSSSFTGRLIDLRDAGAANTTFASLRDVYLGGASAIRTADSLVDISGSHSLRFERVQFRSGAVHGLRGKNSSSDTANGITLIECYFNDNTTTHIRNPGDGWTLIGCVFEALHSGAAGAMACDSGFVCNGVTVIGGWAGDVIAAAGGIQFDFTGNNINIVGTLIGGNTGSTGVKFRNLPGPVAPAGLMVAARFDGTETAIDFAGAAPENYNFSSSSFASNVTTALTGGVFMRTALDTRDDQAILGLRNRSSASGRVALRFQGDRTSAYVYDIGMDLDGGNAKRFGLRDQSRSGTPWCWYCTNAGSVVLASGAAALARSATDGFVYIPSMAGSPTGTPSSVTGAVPIVGDTTNGLLWAYLGSWISLGGGAGWTAVDASEAIKGIAEIATQTETNTGTDDARIVTPLKMATRVAAMIAAAAPAAATASAQGIVELATTSEATTGTDTTRAVTPAGLKAAIDNLIAGAPGALDTLNEIATQLATDESAVSALTATVAGKQTSDATLTAIAGLVNAANKIMYFTGVDTVATLDFLAWAQTFLSAANVGAAQTALGISTFIKTLLDDADAATARTTLSAAQKRVVTSVTSSSTPAPAGDADDNCYTLTALAANATFAAPSGTPADFNELTIRIKDNGTARTLAWNAAYRNLGGTLPTTTVISKTLYIGFRYNAADSKWDFVASRQEA